MKTLKSKDLKAHPQNFLFIYFCNSRLNTSRDGGMQKYLRAAIIVNLNSFIFQAFIFDFDPESINDTVMFTAALAIALITSLQDGSFGEGWK